MAEEEFVKVYTAQGIPEAYIIKGRLETEGIPVFLRYESAGLVYGLTIDGMGQVRVMVPASAAQSAREILRETPSSSDPAPDTEP